MSKDSKRSRSASEMAHNIWLAGLGAYGRAWDEAQGTLKRVEESSSAVFDELVSKGTEIERETQDKVKKTAERIDTFSIEDRIARVRQSFGLSSAAQSDEKLDQVLQELAKLSDHVETLSNEVRKLQQNQGE